jgi:O-antigen/teichoic acid export membrane protein
VGDGLALILDSSAMALHRFAHNTLFATIAGASIAIGSLIGSIIVARLLGPPGAGAVALALWIAGTSVTFADLGLPLTISRFLPDLHARGRNDDAYALARSFTLPLLATTLVGFGLALALFLLTDALRANYPGILPFDHLSSTIWLAIGAVFAAQAMGNFGMSFLRGEQRFRLAALLAMAAFLLQIASVALGAYYCGVEGALFGFGVAGLLPATVVLRLGMGKHPLDQNVKRRAWTFAIHSWGAGLISAIVWGRTELAFLSHWRSAEEAGYYAVGITISMIAVQLPLLSAGSLLALFSERYGSNDREGLRRAYEKATRFMALLLFPACFGMAAICPLVLPLFFGPSFAKASDVTALLVAAQGLGALSAVSSNFLFAAERSRFLVRIGIFGALALLIAGLTIIPTFGLIGTAATRAIIQVGLAAAAFIYIGRKLHYPPPTLSLVLTLIAAIACAGAARFVVTEIPTALGLVLAIATGFIVYAFGVRFLKILPQEDLDQIAALVARLPANLARALLPVIKFLAGGKRTAARPPAIPYEPTHSQRDRPASPQRRSVHAPSHKADG